MLEVGKKWGCKYGAKSFEIENALNEAIIKLRNGGREKSKAVHTHTKRDNAIEEVARLTMGVSNALFARGKDPRGWMTEKQFLTAIKRVEGLKDRRPAKDRLELLLDSGLWEQKTNVDGRTKLIRLTSFERQQQQQESEPSAVKAKAAQIEEREHKAREEETNRILAKYAGDLR